MTVAFLFPDRGGITMGEQMNRAAGLGHQEDQQTQAERRAHPRVALEVPALIDSVRAWERCWCSNLSEGGLALRLATQLRIGDAVDVYFELPGGSAVETPSRVVDVSGDCVRVKFERLSGEQRLNVFRYVVSKRPPPPRRPRRAP